MAYTSYEFYTETFYGDAVPEDDFDRFEARACEYVDALTFDRLIDGYPTDEKADVKIQKAVCAVAEVLYNIELVRAAALESIGTVTRSDGTVTSKAVASISSGSESISYSTSGSTTGSSVYEQAAADKTVEKTLIRQTVDIYLAGVRDSYGTLVLYGGF